MQQKRGGSWTKKLLLLCGVAVVGVLVALMFVNIPAPQKAVEKELDAKVFLEQKP